MGVGSGLGPRRRTSRLAVSTAVAWMAAAVAAAEPKCAQVYYDAVPAGNHTFGKTAASFLVNLMGHFPHVSTQLLPVEGYQEGDVERCHTSFYVGTFYDNAVPAAFKSDFQTTKRTVVWMGYNVWQLPARTLQTLWNVQFGGLSKVDGDPEHPETPPHWYQLYDYKGETFVKWDGTWDSQGHLLAPYEISLFKPLGPETREYQIAAARHTGTGAEVPYILRNGNHWVVGDNPFSYITEDDRYLIIADVLFDMLDEKPRYDTKPALVRLEDVHPRVPLRQLEAMLDAFDRQGVPFAISLIPIFADPLHAMPPADEDYVPLTERPAFVGFLRKASSKKAAFLFHGLTHQYEKEKNPYSGASGIDFEFWNAVKNQPVDRDSPAYVVDRLEKGIALMEKAGVKPTAWLTPHYSASALDYIIFGQLFDWSVGRLLYVDHEPVQAKKLPCGLRFDTSGSKENGSRLPYFQDLDPGVKASASVNGQFFPYEVYSDAYGAGVIPETVGYLQPRGPMAPTEITVDVLIRRIKRNSVLRDVWASFFFHPFMLEAAANGGFGEYSGDVRPIERLLSETKQAGYAFVDLRAWVKDHAPAGSQGPRCP